MTGRVLQTVILLAAAPLLLLYGLFAASLGVCMALGKIWTEKN